MQYGKIRIQDGELFFKKHMIDNALPCCDILWAYRRRVCEQTGEDRGQPDYTIQNFVMIVTRRGKRYKFPMTEQESILCLEQLFRENPKTAIGYPRGGRLPLVSLSNTRDLGALKAKDGKCILPRRLLRSGELYHVSRQDQKVLTQDYRLRTVIDFRTERERKNKPDTYMEGVRYIRMPILEEETVGVTKERDFLEILTQFPGTGSEFLEQQYYSLALDRYCTDQYAKFFNCLLEQEDGAVLWHCSMGKDRVGVGTALLLFALGMPKNVIYTDFVRTNEFLEEELLYFLRLLEARGGGEEEAEKLRMLFQVQETYLSNVFYRIKQEFGSMEQYLRKRMYLTPKALEELRKKYLI